MQCVPKPLRRTDFTLNLICFSQKSTNNLEITILCFANKVILSLSSAFVFKNFNFFLVFCAMCTQTSKKNRLYTQFDMLLSKKHRQSWDYHLVLAKLPSLLFLLYALYQGETKVYIIYAIFCTLKQLIHTNKRLLINREQIENSLQER